MKRSFITLYALAATALTAVAQPRFTSNTETYDFGQIEWKHPVTVQYSITNTGNQPLVLTDVRLFRSPVDKDSYRTGGKGSGRCHF